MRATGNFQLHTLLFLLLATFTAAWPVWPRWLPDLDTLVVRQDSDSTSSTSPATKSTASSSSPKETGSTSGSTSGGSKTTTRSESTTKGGSSSTTKKATTTSKSISIDDTLPAGGISLITPAVALGSQFYKIGDFVTFAWNYTSLQSTPTAVNVYATCTANAQLYTLATNQTFNSNATGAVTWDTGAYQATAQASPLLTETYTLIIYDAASSISATAQAGLLSVFKSYSFGMYVPQAYTPLGEYVCVTCSGALSEMERRALGMVIGVSAVTVLSFTWFVGGTGIIW